MEELIEKAKHGSEDAFANLILNYQQDLYKIALTRLHTEYDIEEAIQETMISAFKNIRKIKEADKFKKWIIKILINKCNDIYRKRKFKLISIEEIDESTIYNTFNLEVEAKLDFYTLINSLTSDEKVILILYYCDKYTTKEIGEILNKKENTIKTILHRTKIKLKNKYKNLLEF